MKNIQYIPVLFMPFSRPHYARQVFDVIKKVKPKNLYFYCDKARDGNEVELLNNNIIREYINEVDWECKLQTWFREKNIGAYSSILNAIDWFFESEELGIILEEDCLPSIAFFDFCRQLLPMYKDDLRIWLISGNNFIEGYNPNGYDYIFSSLANQWGWATWKSRWKCINRQGFDINEIIKYKLNHQIYGGSRIGKFADLMYLNKKDADGYWKPVSWDYIFLLSMQCNGGLAIIPARNLVSNIGVTGLNSKKLNKLRHNRSIPSDNKYIIKKHPPFFVSDIKYTTEHLRSIKKSLFRLQMKKIINLIFK